MDRRERRRTGRRALALALAVGAFAGTAAAQGKKLEVILERTELRLKPDSGSEILTELLQGTVLSQAAPVKSRTYWYYVYYAEPGTGRIRAGYVHDTAVQYVVPTLKVIAISTPGEPDDPMATGSNGEPRLDWGRPLDAFLAAEGRPVDRVRSGEAEIVKYRREILGNQCLVEYTFADGVLAAARFTMLQHADDTEVYIRDYGRMKEYLARRLGAPREEMVLWSDDKYRAEDGTPARALALGHLVYRSHWVSAGTELRLVLAGGGDGVTFGAECRPIPVSLN